MNSDAFFAALIREIYAADDIRLRPLARVENHERALYLAEQPDRAAWVVKLYRAGLAVPEWLAGCGAPDMPTWLAGRAATLDCLERQGYPAPRVVRTRSGALAGAAQGWLALATTYLPGAIAQPTLAQIEQAGAALGRLHTLVPAADIGRSWWHAGAAIPQMRAWLDAAAPSVVPEWAELHAGCRATAEAFARRADDLPAAIIHGDAWAANLVQTAPGALSLIDWDTGGLGLAVLDMGRLLVECHLDLGQPNDGHIQPDAARISAAADGYRRWRSPSAAELDMLLEALRFGVAYLAAWHFALARAGGYTSSIVRRLGRARNRYAIAPIVAELARRRLTQSSQPSV